MSDAKTTDAIEQTLPELTRYFYALKETWRLRIIRTLASQDEMTVSDLAKQLDISQPLVSWHMRRLRQAKIVTVRRKGRENYYALDRKRISTYKATFDQLLQSGESIL